MLITLAAIVGATAALWAAYQLGLLDPLILKHDVTAITASLAKMRVKLLADVEHHTATADAHTQAAIDSHAQAIASTQEATAAAKVADNLGAILA